MAWHRKGNKPLSEPMLTQFTDAYMRGTRGRCVKYRKNTGFAGFQWCTRFYKTFYVVPHLLNLCNCMSVASPLSYVNRCCSAVYIFIHTPIEAWTKWLTFSGTSFRVIWIKIVVKIPTFSPKKMHLKMLSVSVLTHWGRVTHLCVSKLTIIGSDNGLSPD